MKAMGRQPQLAVRQADAQPRYRAASDVGTLTLAVPLLQFPGGKPRSLEDLKARYYAVARQLLVGREGAEDCVANHVLIKHPFNPVHERWGQAVDSWPNAAVTLCTRGGGPRVSSPDQASLKPLRKTGERFWAVQNLADAREGGACCG